jgi:hypothetical protein
MTRLRVVAAALVALLGGAAIGCESSTAPNDFVIRVDSVATTLSAPDTLRLRFHGNIGASSCYRLARVEFNRSDVAIDLTFHGEHDDSTGGCRATVVPLEWEYTVPAPLLRFDVRVRQPDGSWLLGHYTLVR